MSTQNSNGATKRHVDIFDTTLRDGSQGEGISFSVEDKVKIAKRLDAFKIDYIEGGWPGSNPKDIEFFDRMKSVTLTHSKLTAFGSTRRPNRKAVSGVMPRLPRTMSLRRVRGMPIAFAAAFTDKS